MRANYARVLMSLELEIVSLLHEKIGFNPESVGSDKIRSGYCQNRGK